MQTYGTNPAQLHKTLHSSLSFYLLSDPGDHRFKTVGCRGATSPGSLCPKLGNEGSWVPPGHNICPSETNTPSLKQADGKRQARDGRSKHIPLQPLATCNDFMV